MPKVVSRTVYSDTKHSEIMKILTDLKAFVANNTDVVLLISYIVATSALIIIFKTIFV